MEKRKTRRNVFGIGILVGGISLASISVLGIKHIDELLRNPIIVFERDSYFNAKELQKLYLKKSRKEWNPTEKEKERHLEELVKKVPVQVNIEDIKFVESYKERWVRIEPNTKYAENLIKEAEKSIEHMIGFIGSSYIQKPKLKFEIPQERNQIKEEFGEEVIIYLVAGVGESRNIKYKIKVNEKNIYSIVSLDKEFYGENEIPLKIEAVGDGFVIRGALKTPVFYNTSTPRKIELIETPAIEVLHLCLRPYTLEHIIGELKNLREKTHVTEVMTQNAWEEEKLVHGISILWWEKYNRDRNFGFEKEELEKRFKEYEIFPQYKGTNKLSEYISEIGVEKAIELYVTNPEELFKRIER